MNATVCRSRALFAAALWSAQLLLASSGRCQPAAGPPPAPPSPPSIPVLPNVPAPTNQPTVLPSPAVVAPAPFRPAPRPIVHPVVPPALMAVPAPVVWDAMSKDYNAMPGEAKHDFTFSVTNTSSMTAYIQKLRPSCGCTVATLPSSPWRLEPGAGGDVHISIDLRGKFGSVTKFIFVDGLVVRETNPVEQKNPSETTFSNGLQSQGVRETNPVARTNSFSQTLNIHVNIPGPNPVSQNSTLPRRFAPTPRDQNMEMAKADRQAVFKGDCASCHAAPAHGKSGAQLFQAVCGICHISAHRASMVPDLAGPKPGVIRNQAYWQTWIESGRPGTLMPGFSDDPSVGGPLTSEQINSLAAYLAKAYPARGTPVR